MHWGTVLLSLEDPFEPPIRFKNAAKKYGFELVNIKDFKKLDHTKDVALILVHGKFFSSQWHWMCYPINGNIEHFFGPDTKIDKIYLLKKNE